MNSMTRFGYIRFLSLFLLFVLATKSLIYEHSLKHGMHLAALTWAFFVICLPLSRGNIIFGIPLRLFNRYAPALAETCIWTCALFFTGFSYLFVPHIFFKTRITLILYHLLSHPYPYYVVFIMCALATFYNAFPHPTHRRKKYSSRNMIGLLLIVLSYAITICMTFRPFVITFNSHGTA